MDKLQQTLKADKISFLTLGENLIIINSSNVILNSSLKTILKYCIDTDLKTNFINGQIFIYY